MARLIISNLFRNPLRAGLTFLSLVVAFMLFLLLRAIAGAFSGDVDLEGIDRLVVDAKYSMTDNLPLAYVGSVRSQEGVHEVTSLNWFGGYYRDPTNRFATLAVAAESFFDVFSDRIIDPDTLERFKSVRIAVVAEESLAATYGWKVGDAVVLVGDIWPRRDGAESWEFTFAGTFSYAEGQSGTPTLLLHYDYFNESVFDWAQDQVGWLVVRVEDGANADVVAQTIDALFSNSSDPTRTTSEDQYLRQFASQLGDIGAIASAILAAVFFTIILLTSNTVSQSFRERIAELAVLKSIGFTDSFVSTLIWFEAIAVCFVGAIAGMIAAFLVLPGMEASLQAVTGQISILWIHIAEAFGLALAMGFVIGMSPALSAWRLSIVNALRAD